MTDMPATKDNVVAQEISAEERRRLYNEAVRKSNLVNIYLSKVSFDVNRQEFIKARPTISFGSTVDRFAYNAEKGGCLISIKWRVDMKNGKKMVAKCAAVYDIAYDGLSTSDESVLRIFAENVATAATYAYFRSLFATFDWSANLRTPPLPVLKLFPKV